MSDVSLIDAEPVRVANAVNGLLIAIAPLGQLFGLWELTADQLGGVTVAVLGIGTFIATVWSRSRVSPV